MTISYASAAHVMYILIALLIPTVLYFVLRGKSQKMQKYVIISIMLLNVFQHLFKSLIYPQYLGFGFNALNTAYNMCAFLILISPIALLIPIRPVRDFVFYAGSFAGIIAVIVPYWHIGEYAFTWDVIRFFICHALLFTSSVLTIALGLHKPSYKCFPFLGLGFLLGVGLVILNDVICLSLGIYIGFEHMEIGEALRTMNPCWSFGVPEQFSFIIPVAKFFLPDFMVGENATGSFTPILWYAIPVYLAMTLLAFPITVAVDRKRFSYDLKRYLDSTKK